MTMGLSLHMAPETSFELRQTLVPIWTAVCPVCRGETMLLPVRTVLIVAGETKLVSLYVCQRGHATFEPLWRRSKGTKGRTETTTPSCTPGCALPFDLT